MRTDAKPLTAGPNQRRARGRRFAIGALLALLALLSIAPNASAAITTRAQTGSFGANGTAFSSFGDPSKLGFDQASDRLYVLEREGSDIHAFETPGLALTGGNFPLSVPATTLSAGLGVDHTGGATAGRVYYTGFNVGVLHGFDSTGTALGSPFPISPPSPKFLVDVAVDSAGNLAIGNNHESAKKVLRYAPDGTPLASVDVSGQEIGRPSAVAFDSEDNLYVVVTGSSTKVHRYEAPSYAPLLPPIETDGLPQALAVDTSSDALYVAHPNRVRVFDATSGAHLYDFARNIAGASFKGVAIDQGTDTVYVSDTGNDKVHVFGPVQSFGDATGTPVAAKEVTDESAVVGATVTDNNVLATNWRLEVSKDGGSSWEAVGSGTTSNKSAVVAATGPSVGTLTVKAGGGTYKLGFEAEATAAIPYNASAGAVESALEALAAIEPGDVEVSGGPGNPTGSTPYTIIFTGSLAGTPVTEIGTDPLNLVGAPQAVSATATGLDPNTPYKFRVVTNKGTTEATEVPSVALGFTTEAPPPVVTDVGAIQVQDTSARLVGTVDPRNNPTGYVFEYGTTPALGSSTPPVGIGSGLDAITVSQVVKGLQKDTFYYFRLVATNLAGTTPSAPIRTFQTRNLPFPPAGSGSCPNAKVRSQQGSAFLPDCRAYEMVSPVDKNQGGVGTLNAAFSRDGESVAFCTSALFGDPPGQQSFTCAPYLSRRGAGGWTTSSPFPRFCNVDPDTANTFGRLPVAFSPGFDRFVLGVPESSSCQVPPLDPAAPMPSRNLYRQDLSAGPAGFDLLTPNPAPPNALESATIDFAAGTFLAGSDDFDHVLYWSNAKQTADAPAGDFIKLFEWVAEGEDGCAQLGGCLRIVSVDTGGTPFATRSNITTNSAIPIPQPGVVSSDGERIYFQNELTNSEAGGDGCHTPACQLYLREGGITTHVSASECTIECGAESSPDRFLWATPSGERAFFWSCSKLTDASAPATACNTGNSGGGELFAKLYRWDRSAPPGGHLADMTIDKEPADGIQVRSGDLIGASEDGDTAFFVARGQLVAGEPTGSDLKLYRWHWNGGSPETDYLGPYLSVRPDGTTVNLTDDRFMLAEDPNTNRMHARVTPDGKYLLIQSKLALDPAGDRDTDVDVYRWDEVNEWICVSCQIPGAPSAGHANTTQAHLVRSVVSVLSSLEPEHPISDDGQRIFFQTPDALAPQDTNGEGGCPLVPPPTPTKYACQDIYEWHDGTLSLISTGTGAEPAFLMGATHDGEEVFFLTGDRLVGWDADNGIDIYSARTGGGFPEPASQPPACESEGCRGERTEAPEVTGAGTAAFQGAGNPKPEARGNRCPANRLRRGKRCLTVAQLARKRCRRLEGAAKRRCVRRQARRLRRAQRRSKARANAYRRAAR